METDHLFHTDCSIAVRKYDDSFNEIIHFHDCFELKFVLSGEADFLINDRKLVLRKGQIMLVGKGCKQQFQGITNSSEIIGILFKNKISLVSQLRQLGQKENCLVYDYLKEHFLKNNSEPEYLVLELEDFFDINNLLRSLIKEMTKVNKHTELINSLVDVLFYNLSRLYYERLAKIYEEKNINLTIVTVLKKIENEYKTLSLARLSDELGYNMNYLSNLIKEKTGKTFKKLVSEVRVKKAYELIVNSNISIRDIAKDVGYSNRSYFYMKFEEYYGTTPTSFRSEKAEPCNAHVCDHRISETVL